MAKSKSSSMGGQKEAYKYPSHYGSHTMMLENDDKVKQACLGKSIPEELAKRGIVNPVVLKDEFGHYITDSNRLDTGLADPNRYSEDRLTSLFAGAKKDKDK